MAHGLTRIPELRFVVLEKAARLGGTWRDNRYPGCACDIPSHLYSLSFAPNPDWSRMFAPQPEILAYMEGVAERIGLGERLRLGVGVAAARWDEQDHCWRLALSNGTELVTRVLISAMGVLHHPALPDIPGRDDFAGETLHSAIWNDQVALAGKRVAVIGTGASAIQIVPEIAKLAGGVTVFQRTPPWIAPKYDRPIEAERRAQFARRPLSRLYFRAQLWWAHEKRARGFTSQHPGVLAKTEAMCRRHLERQVKDPELRARLTPNYAVGCKRLLISNDWYPALQRANVALVTDGIARIVKNGVVDGVGRLHPADVIIYSTGFDAQGALSRVNIAGTDGRLLADVWRDTGKSAYLGTTVHGFPNLFLMTGPNAGSGHTSQLFMLEAQAHYIARAVARMRARRATRMEVTARAQAAFAADMQGRLDASVWHGGGCRSWYLDANGRNTVLWPSLSTDFWWRTRWVRGGDYGLAGADRIGRSSFLKKSSQKLLAVLSRIYSESAGRVAP
jgi:cation diffusion facilitator CzcD-associated flavoprotein CzcO